MAKYSDIKGFTVQTLSSDTVASQFAGGTWASGGALPAGVSSGMGFGTQTASVLGGGYNGTTYVNTVYEYDGSSWSSGGSLTASAGQARTGHGILTAGGAVAGYKTSGNAVINNYETYDGTSFTEQADLNTARQTLSAAGSTTAALAAGGTTSVGPGSTQEGLTNVESYNGSSWTETTENNTARKQGTSFSGGPAPTMIFIGGASDSTFYANVETYNGSAWTEITDLNTARSALGGAGQAQTDGLVFGGSVPSNTAVTEQWNGTTWTELADLSTARNTLVGSGTGAAAALAAGGYSTAAETATEEFTAPSTFNQITEGQLFFNSTTNTFKETLSDIPAGSFASGGNLNRNRYVIGGCGVSTAALAAGGDFYAGPPNSPSDRSGVDAEVYNGSTWTEVADMNNDVQGTYSASGTSTAAITNANLASDTHIESWNGSAWTNAPDINSPRADASMPSGGSQTASLLAGGYEPPGGGPKDKTEQYDGSSWSEITEINTGRYSNRNTGTSTDNLLFGGNGTPSYTGKTEQWNGTAWTELSDLPVGRANHGGFGTGSTLAVTTNGDGPNSLGAPNPTGANSSKALNFWNGTSWSADADDAPYKVRNPGSGGSATDGLVFGGIGDPNTPVYTTVEWTVDLSNKTITSS